MTRPLPAGLDAQARAWVRATYGDTMSAAALEVLPGHAGLTYALDVADPSGTVVDRLVLRLPPLGVRRHGSTDVLRQAPLLRTLSAAGVPVADVREASDDERWFDVPYLVVARMPGRTVSIDQGGEPPRQEHFHASVAALAALHSVPWQTTLSGWSDPRSYADEVHAWDRALHKVAGSSWHADAESVRVSLLQAAPQKARTGVNHGDYQFSNLLFVDEQLTAVLDWEIAGIGPQLLDLGWFLVINDQRSWAHAVVVEGRPSDAELLDTYQDALGIPVDRGELAYSRALSAYRFAVIAGLNLSLHRSGRRVDEHWETLEPSIPVLLARAWQDLASAG